MRKILEIQTTSICNARCLMCPYVDSYVSKFKEVMSDDVFARIISEAKRTLEFVPKIPLYMWNEPLTDPKLEQRTFSAARLPCGFIELSTNASLLSPVRAYSLVSVLSKFPTRFIISVPSIRKDEYERITGLRYYNVMENIEDWLRISDGKVRNVIHYVYKNFDPSYVGWWMDLSNRMALKQPPRVRAIQVSNRAGNLRTGPYVYDNGIVRKWSLCHRLTNWLHFNWRGDLLICCNDVNCETIVGNIMDTPLDELVKWIVPRSKEVELCKRCDRRAV